MNEAILDACDREFEEAGIKLLNDAFQVANRYGPATDSIQRKFQDIMNEAYTHSKSGALPFKERKMILKAMDLARGHWFKCANGHVYAIDGCGARKLLAAPIIV